MNDRRGFAPQDDLDICTIRFPEESPFFGAVVKTLRRASLRQALEWDRLRLGQPQDEDATGDARSIYETLRDWGERYLISWNLLERHTDETAPQVYDADGGPVPTYVKGDDGEDAWFPVPCTTEALLRQRAGFALELFHLHVQEVSGGSFLSGTPSSDTPPSREPPTPKPAKSSRSRPS